MKIPRKLGLSFVLICASAAIMMTVFSMNISMIRNSTDQNNKSQSLHSRAMALETALLRQNSQLRGFLVTADSSYLKSYYEGRDDYDATSRELEKELEVTALRAALLKSREETLAWRANWGDRLIKVVESGQRQAAADDVRAAGKAAFVSEAVLPLREIRDAQLALIKENSERQESAITTATTVLVIGGVALIGIAITLAVMLSRIIARPITGLTRTMADLAAGKNDISVPDANRGDELGDMARAVLVFRDAAVAKQAADEANARADADQKIVVETVSSHLSELAGGNLTAEITSHFPGHYATMKTNFNAALSALRGLIASVTEAASTIHTGSTEIARASEDLARRTESNAASLEETAASITQMDGRLKAGATAASQTVQRADQAITTVGGGRSMADEAVQAMGRVSASAKGIDSVIEGLDKIAFQTRVLAMNAAVEAGRAGDAGRGFAVVADLVSALAMRAEEEAKRARDQLSVTQADIGFAVEVVRKVDGALADISNDVGQVHELLATMATDNQAQSVAIGEVSSAINTMDRATQQNAAMVEETSAAARNLVGEVSGLFEKASRFNVGKVSRNATRLSAPASFAVAPKPRSTPALAPANGDWQEF